MNKPVTFGIFLKLIICLNIVFLAFCFAVCNIRTTQDQETLNDIQQMENRIETQCELIELQRELINMYKNN